MHQDIELNIESLLIEGYSPLDALRLKEAIEWELTRILGEQGLGTTQTTLVDLADLSLDLPHAPSLSLNTTGGQIAQTLHQGIQSAMQQPAESQYNKQA